MMLKFLIFFVTFAFASVNPGDSSQDITPSFIASQDVFFVLFSRFNPTIGQILRINDTASIVDSNYDVNRQTRFVIHGFQSDTEAPIIQSVVGAYLRSYDVNVIAVDWGAGANTLNYITARNRVGEVGAFIASFIDFMHESNLLDFHRLIVVGSSLGAHVAGFTGKNTQRGKIKTIFGIDPAGPLFDANNPLTRIAPGDAEYVECIHTDSRNFGIGDAICDTDFKPNAGRNQPGCLSSVCDHLRAFNLFAESLNTDQLWGRRCNNIGEIHNGCTGEGAHMGGEPGNFGRNINGIYTMTTNAESPFGQGKF